MRLGWTSKSTALAAVCLRAPTQPRANLGSGRAPAHVPSRRRHGIQRWPRRQLAKVNKALDELEARQMLQPQQHLAAAPHGGYDMGGPRAADALVAVR